MQFRAGSAMGDNPSFIGGIALAGNGASTVDIRGQMKHADAAVQTWHWLLFAIGAVQPLYNRYIESVPE